MNAQVRLLERNGPLLFRYLRFCESRGVSDLERILGPQG